MNLRDSVKVQEVGQSSAPVRIKTYGVRALQAGQVKIQDCFRTCRRLVLRHGICRYFHIVISTAAGTGTSASAAAAYYDEEHHQSQR